MIWNFQCWLGIETGFWISIPYLVSSTQVIDICFDKLSTHDFLQKVGLNSPQTFSTLDEARDAIKAGHITLPLVIAALGQRLDWHRLRGR
ncbi:MAG: hypothetical protein R2864_14030 [Syntrophotaleaceae bacterium]